jgi:hypothetical protein
MRGGEEIKDGEDSQKSREKRQEMALKNKFDRSTPVWP